MKSYIIGVALFIIFMMFTFYQYDYNRHQEQLYNLKFVAEEAAAAAAQYMIVSDVGDGDLIFNRQESIIAAEYVLSRNMKLNENLYPTVNSYWQEQIRYDINFFDNSNANFPMVYEDTTRNFVLTILEPTVVIKVNAGSPRYKLISNPPDVISIAAHEWKDR